MAGVGGVRKSMAQSPTAAILQFAMDKDVRLDEAVIAGLATTIA
jgi:hypothetical protein